MLDFSDLERQAKQLQRKYRLTMATLAQQAWANDPRRDILAKQARERYDAEVARLRDQATEVIGKAVDNLDERKRDAAQMRAERLERAFAKVNALAAEQYRQMMANASDRTVLEAYRAAEPGSWQRLIIESLNRTEPKANADGTIVHTGPEVGELRRLVSQDQATIMMGQRAVPIPTEAELDSEEQAYRSIYQGLDRLDPETYDNYIVQRFRIEGVMPQQFSAAEMDAATLELGATGGGMPPIGASE